MFDALVRILFDAFVRILFDAFVRMLAGPNPHGARLRRPEARAARGPPRHYDAFGLIWCRTIYFE